MQTGEADKGTAGVGGRRKGFQVPPVQPPKQLPGPHLGNRPAASCRMEVPTTGRRQVLCNRLGVCLHLGQQPCLSHPCVPAPGTMHAAQSNTPKLPRGSRREGWRESGGGTRGCRVGWVPSQTRRPPPQTQEGGGFRGRVSWGGPLSILYPGAQWLEGRAHLRFWK